MRGGHERGCQRVPDDALLMLIGVEGEEVNSSFQVTCGLFLMRFGMGGRYHLKTSLVTWGSWFESQMKNQWMARGSQGWNKQIPWWLRIAQK